MNILITGASRGIGKGLAIEYAQAGNTLFLMARDNDRLSELKETIIRLGAKCQIYKTDVTNINQIETGIKHFDFQTKGIDLVFLNAGIGIPSRFSDFDISIFRKVYDVNVFGVINFFQYLLPIMKKQGHGIIAVTSSLADSRGFPFSSAYSSSKAAITRILEAARLELKEYNINIITIRPGFVKTDMTDQNKYKMPFLMSSEKACVIIRNGIDKRKAYIDFPFPTAFLTRLLYLMPNTLYEFLFKPKINKKLEQNNLQ